MPSTDHPDSSEDSGDSTNEVLCLKDRCTCCDAATSVIEAESLEHEAHVPSFNKAQQLKATDLLDSIQRRMKDKDNFMIEGEEMMSCCLTKETRQTAPRHAPDEERNCRVGGRGTKYSLNYEVHSLRNGHFEALAKLNAW